MMSKMKLLAHRIDQTDQVLMFLLRAIEITLFVNQPGNFGVRAELRAQLLGAYTRGMHEIGPPMIVRLRFVFSH